MFLDDFFSTKPIVHHACKESNGNLPSNKKEEIDLVLLLFQYVVQYYFAKAN